MLGGAAHVVAAHPPPEPWLKAWAQPSTGRFRWQAYAQGTQGLCSGVSMRRRRFICRYREQLGLMP